MRIDCCLCVTLSSVQTALLHGRIVPRGAV
jgi:hypothetical protein